jgi:integrase
LLTALGNHAEWYKKRFGAIKSEEYLFPGRVGTPEHGKRRPLDPARPVTTLKTAWKNVKIRAGVKGRFHDTRHTLITELAESGAGDQTIMDIAGHVSRQMLSRYSHIRMEAKRRALEGVGTSVVPVETPAESVPRRETPTVVLTEVGHKTGHNRQQLLKRRSA